MIGGVGAAMRHAGLHCDLIQIACALAMILALCDVTTDTLFTTFIVHGEPP